MRVDGPHGIEALLPGYEHEPDGKNDLTGDLLIGVHEQVKRGGNHTLVRVFNGSDAHVRVSLSDHGKDIPDGLGSEISAAAPEGPACSLVSEGGLRAKIGYSELISQLARP